MELAIPLITLGIVVALLIVGQIIGKNRQKAAMQKGEIIERPKNYESLAEIFTLRAMDPNVVNQAIHSIDYSRMFKVEMRFVPDRNCFEFLGRAKYGSTVLWTARLSFFGTDGVWMRYCFEFLRWNSNLTNLEMNQLLTAIEKTFLMLDPQTSVQTEARNVSIG